jgi:hypothetical protein
MKLIRTISLVAVVASVAMLTTSRALAQAEYTPSLSVTANGNVVTISWSAIAQAEGYELIAGFAPGGSDVGITVPASAGTYHVISAPSGTYFLRVRAGAGALRGPFSNEVRVDVNTAPPVPCGTPDVPQISTVVQGPNVTVSWPLVPGATAYQLQFSRTPGATELVVNTTTNARIQYVPAVGTFYVRVVAGTPCGQSVSAEQAFTIDNLNGSGPRTPDPPPGVMLPLPDYGYAIAQVVAAQYRGDLENACRSRTFLFRLVQALRQLDSRWGLNYKRGHHELSHDIITYNGTDEPDNGADHIYLVDVISGVEDCGRAEDKLRWNWHETTTLTWAAAGSGACGTFWCAKWTIDPYLNAGFPADPRQ